MMEKMEKMEKQQRNWYYDEVCCWGCENEEQSLLLFYLLSNSLHEPISLITASMSVHPFYHREEGHSGWWWSCWCSCLWTYWCQVWWWRWVWPCPRTHHLDRRFYEIPSIPSGKEEDEEAIRQDNLDNILIVVTVVINIIVVPICMTEIVRQTGWSGYRPFIGLFCFPSFSDGRPRKRCTSR